MGHFKNILFPTDFSPNAGNALAYALDLVKKSNARFSLLHVYDLPWNAHEKAEDSIVNVREKTRNSALDRLKKIISQNGLEDHPHRCYVREGGVSQCILEVIAQDDIDLVVMGTQGATAERGLFLGSVTKQVIQNAASPVLAIPPTASPPEPISKIVYATSLQYNETQLVKFVVHFARLYNADIHILHVASDEGNIAWNRKELQKIIKSTAYPKITFKEFIMNDPEEGIHQYMDEIKANLLTMTTYSTTLFDKLFRKSLTKEILLHTELPLLAFNRKKYNKVFI